MYAWYGLGKGEHRRGMGEESKIGVVHENLIFLAKIELSSIITIILVRINTYEFPILLPTKAISIQITCTKYPN
jgi:hypothetical protein